MTTHSIMHTFYTLTAVAEYNYRDI